MNKLIPKVTLSTLFLISTTITDVLIYSPIAISQEIITESAITEHIEKVSVQIEDGLNEQGTDVIIDKQGDNYIVLTNWHVVDQDQLENQRLGSEKKIVSWRMEL